MKAQIILISIVILFAANLTFAESLQTKQKPSDIPKNSQQVTDNHQRGSEQFHVIVKITTPEKSKEEAGRDTKEKEEKSGNENRLVIFTSCLAVIGLVQALVFGYQAVCLSNTVKATKEAADAANKSAIASEKTTKSIEDSERPYIFIKVSGTFQECGEGFKQCDYTITMHN
jgi:hypothetical protein